MADSIASRREARIKRILENSQNRLLRISGKIDDDNFKGSPITATVLDHNHDCQTPATSESAIKSKSSLNNGIIITEIDPVRIPPPHIDTDSVGDRIIENDIANFGLFNLEPVGSDLSKPTIPLWDKIITYKYDVVILSLMVQLLYSLSLFSVDNDTAYIFLPLIIYTITKIMWLPTTPNPSFIANTLMLMHGIQVERVQWILDIMRYFSVFSQDVCVYLFTMICVQTLGTSVFCMLIT